MANQTRVGRRDAVNALNRIGFCADVLDDGRVHGKAYSGAAWQLRSAEGDFVELFESGKLGSLPGIGDKMMEIDGQVQPSQAPGWKDRS